MVPKNYNYILDFPTVGGVIPHQRVINVSGEDVTIIGYFKIEPFKEDRYYNLSYKITHIIDVEAYLNGRETKTEGFILENVERPLDKPFIF